MGSEAKELVLVDGATGFIGSHTVEFLLSKGFSVRATDLPRANFSFVQSLGAELMPADLLNPKEIKPLLKGVSRVFHIAGLFDLGLPYDTLYAANVKVTENMCKAAAEVKVESFVHWSTVGVYGWIKKSPVEETHPKNPSNTYEETKWKGEQIALRYWREKGLPVRVIRPTLVYGPRNRYGVALFQAILASVNAIRSGLNRLLIQTTIKGGPVGHYVHAKDVAQAAWFLSEKEEAIGEAYNIADDTPLDIGKNLDALMEPLPMQGGPLKVPIPTKFVTKAAKAAKREGVIKIFAPLNRLVEINWAAVVKEYNLVPALRPRIDADWVGYAVGNHTYDNTKIKKLGLKLLYPDLREGIKETTKWYQDNRWLPRF